MKKIIAVSMIAVLAGCATADRAQIADVASTAAAFHLGYVEGNPFMAGLSIGKMAAVKIGMTQVVKTLPPTYCEPFLFSLTAFGYGASIWNIGVMLGSGPASIPLVLALIWTQKVNWYESGARTCADPWHFEPPTVGFDTGWGFQSQ